MTRIADRIRSVSDPDSPYYDPGSPYYDVTADPTSKFFVGPPSDDHMSGDEVRAEVTAAINQVTGPPGGFLDQLLGPVKDSLIQNAYQDRLESSRAGLGENVELRAPGEGPKTLWANASHDQMLEAISSNADSSAVAVSSEEWVRLGNDLSDHQRTLRRAITDSLGDWQGDGGEAARTYLTEVAKWLGGTADGAVLTGRQQEIHSQALNETQKAMAGNPPVPFSAPEANARLSRITDPVLFALQFSAEVDTFNRHQVARDQAAQVMHRFDETIRGSITTPKFTPPPSLHNAPTAKTFFRGAADPTGLEPNLVRASGTASERHGVVRSGGVPIGNRVGVPGGLEAPDGGAPGGSTPFAAALSGGGPPGGNHPDRSGFVPDGVGLGGPDPGGSTVPLGSFPDRGVPGPGRVPGGPGVVSIPPLPEFNPSGDLGPNGSTTTAGFAPSGLNAPNVPDAPRSSALPSTFSSGGGDVPTPGYVPPTFAGPSSRHAGERTTRLPVNQLGKTNLPNVPNSNLTGLGRSFGPGGGVPPSIGGVPGAPRIGAIGGPGPIPGLTGGGPAGPGAVPGGAGVPGGFGPTGGGPSVGAVPAGSTPGGPGSAGGGGGGSAGRGGAAPVGGAGGGGGQNEDLEYQVADYIEGDPDLFAPGRVVSPPVIGDWKSHEDWK